MERDCRVDKELIALDWTVVRFWGNDIKKDLEGCVQAVKETIFEKMVRTAEEEEIERIDY